MPLVAPLSRWARCAPLKHPRRLGVARCPQYRGRWPHQGMPKRKTPGGLSESQELMQRRHHGAMAEQQQRRACAPGRVLGPIGGAATPSQRPPRAGCLAMARWNQVRAVERQAGSRRAGCACPCAGRSVLCGCVHAPGAENKGRPGVMGRQVHHATASLPWARCRRAAKARMRAWLVSRPNRRGEKGSPCRAPRVNALGAPRPNQAPCLCAIPHAGKFSCFWNRRPAARQRMWAHSMPCM